MIRFVTIFLISISLISCRPETFTPKPRGYARTEFPSHQYRSFNEQTFPYSFEYPVYARVITDTLFFGQKPENPYWLNIDFPTLGGTIYLSYKPINAQQPLENLIEDAHEMSFMAHSKRADYIGDAVFQFRDRNVYGILYEVGGNAASAHQFVVTDSVKHFVRGALYFDVTPNADSLKPVNDFLKHDILHLLETLRWKN
ncbi:MAG TPA: gliding motility lipoprotein GldD [Flavipsychrobacter sp.]|nr:gliding motility lipoprotein GldD [Flavipsychrobacter sp.]